MMAFEEQVAKYQAEARKEKIARAATIAVAVLMLIGTIVWRIHDELAIEDNKCPYCGESVHYIGTVIRGGKYSTTTKYRYQCDQTSSHYVDIDYPIN